MSDWRFVVNGVSVDPETDYRFIIQQYPGTGMAGVENISTSFGILDGSIFQRTRTTDRSLSLTGIINGSNASALHQNRKNLINSLKPDRSATQEALVIQYLGGASTLQASAYYESGLELGQVDVTRERIALKFALYDPYFEKTTSTSTTLTTSCALSNANFIVRRKADGHWQALGTGLGSGEAYAILCSTGSLLYAAGTFTTASGGTTNRIAQWNGAWSALGTGMNGQVNEMVLDLGQTNLYAGGQFTTAGGVAACNIAKWNGTAWSNLGVGSASGVNNTVNTVAVGLDNKIYIGGDFTTAGGTAASRVAVWDGSTWAAMGGGSGADNTVNSLTVGPDGTIYATGAFGTIGGIAACRVAAWNGAAWKAIGSFAPSAADGASPYGIYATVDTGRNIVYVGGQGSSSPQAGGVTLPDQFARYIGGTWQPVDVDLPDNVLATVGGIDFASDGAMVVVGQGFSGTASVAAVTAVTNSGTAATYPVFSCSAPTSGSARLYQLINYTTGDQIYFNLVLQPGEVVSLDLRPNKKTFSSSGRGDIISTILPGSNVSTWKLLPGANNVSFYLTGGSGAAKLSWTERFWSLDS